jgi:hypothetical protein
MKKYVVGIHPSWQSGNNESVLQAEIKALEWMKFISPAYNFSKNKDFDDPENEELYIDSVDLRTKIIHSRQHYLRMSFPETYQRLIRAGIKHDYTMGYANTNGFRASYAAPFKWYNLSLELATELVIHPFCFMDATAIFQNRSAVYDAFVELDDLYHQVKSVGGEFTCLFHNEYLTNQPEWLEWKNAYKAFLTHRFQASVNQVNAKDGNQ